MLSLKANPTFKHPVSIHVPGGSPVIVEFEFKHRTKQQMLDWLTEKEQKIKEKKFHELDYVLEMVVGWELSDKFDKKNVGLLLQHYHAAAAAIGAAYVKELGTYRLGN